MHPERHTLASRVGAVLQHDLAGVLIPATPSGRLRNTARLITREGEQTVICHPAPPKSLRWYVWRARVDLLPMPNGDVIATSVRRDDRLDPLDFVQASWCPEPRVINGIKRVVGAIEHPALRRFVRDVFADFRIFEDFWKAASAPDHHHAPGGLAMHALEVVRSVMAGLKERTSDGSSWSQDERDLGILAAMLHDLGECCDNGRPLPDAAEVQRRIMELRHLELIHDAFSRLHGTTPRLGRALLALWFPRQRFPPSDIRTRELHAALLTAHRASIHRAGHASRRQSA